MDRKKKERKVRRKKMILKYRKKKERKKRIGKEGKWKRSSRKEGEYYFLPVEESFPSTHGRELIWNSLEQFVDGCCVCDERTRHLHSCLYHHEYLLSAYLRHNICMHTHKHTYTHTHNYFVFANLSVKLFIVIFY